MKPKKIALLAHIIPAVWCILAPKANCQVLLTNVDHLNLGGSAQSVAIFSNFLYLANYDDGFRIFDISTPASPMILGHTNDNSSVGVATGVAVSGNLAYLANGSDGLRIYDVSNPNSPVNIGYVTDTNNPSAYASGVAVSGNYAYLANGNDGLHIYYIATPSTPLSVSETNNGGFANSVTVSGNYAYVASGGDGLRVYYIGSPLSPTNVGHVNDGGNAMGVTVSGNFAYLANGNDGLRIYDVSNPANPVGVGHTNDGLGFAENVTVSGNYAYVANYTDGLRVYDISTPSDPVNAGHADDSSNGGTGYSVAVSGTNAFLANGEDGLRVFSVTIAAQAAPMLNISFGASNSVVISWSAPSTGYFLQQNNDLTSANWRLVTNVPVTVNGQNQVTISPATGNAFYRLIFLSTPPAPLLSIGLGTGNSVVISWPATSMGFSLQQNSDLTTTNWMPVTSVPTMTNGLEQVTISPATGNAFYRLISQ